MPCGDDGYDEGYSGHYEKMPEAVANIYVFAARYAYNRNTGVALAVVTQLKQVWPRLSERTKKQLQKEVKNEATCNHDDWKQILDLKV